MVTLFNCPTSVGTAFSAKGQLLVELFPSTFEQFHYSNYNYVFFSHVVYSRVVLQNVKESLFVCIQEIDALISGDLTEQDEEDILAELAELEKLEQVNPSFHLFNLEVFSKTFYLGYST